VRRAFLLHLGGFSSTGTLSDSGRVEGSDTCVVFWFERQWMGDGSGTRLQEVDLASQHLARAALEGQQSLMTWPRACLGIVRMLWPCSADC
jgi:hypothetical protein